MKGLNRRPLIAILTLILGAGGSLAGGARSKSDAIKQIRSYPASSVLSAGSVSCLNTSQPPKEGESLQLTAAGHVLIFKPVEVVMAAGDHALKIGFLGSNLVQPSQEGVAEKTEKGTLPPGKGGLSQSLRRCRPCL